MIPYTLLVTAEQTQQLIATQSIVTLDCRFNLSDTTLGQRAYRAGHLPNAHYLHLDHDLSSPISAHSGRHPLPDIATLSQTLRRCGLHQHQQVIVYDDAGGSIAGRAWWLLRWLGHIAVAVLDGGIQAWQAKNYALETHTPHVAIGDFQAKVQTNALVSSEALSQAHEWQLVDARNKERYRGEQEPLDPVAGHIPQALSRPLLDNLSKGKFKPAAQLHQEWQTLLGTTPASHVVHYCGSGVTACHNQLAMELAGLTGSRLYAGSWSEWIRDPQRPIALGQE